jgi:hypothetical protein
MDGALTAHSLPAAAAGDAFGGGAAPEEGVFFFGEGRIGVAFGGVGVILDFVYVVPWGGIQDVGVAFDFALGEYWKEFVRGFEGCRA